MEEFFRLAEEELDTREKNLAAELKALCRDNREDENNLVKSADILLEMGHIYHCRAEYGQGVAQKLSYIRSCALINAAKLRYALKDDAKVAEADKALLQVGGTLFHSAGITRSPDILQQLTTKYRERLYSYRNQVKTDHLQSHTSFEKFQDESIETEVKFISQVEDMLKDSTQKFISLMRDIAGESCALLGKPPCDFCLAGLGSLARCEATLYSDFEHVIVLEDVELDPSNAEYFYWFTLIFQVIVIGFGETFLASVGVESLNDLYSDEDSANWFYDAITPDGLAFDGMAPHSCAIPLGRTRKTKFRDHQVSLIQPVYKMVSYLTCEEHLKNGYYLKNLLTQTTFVAGNIELYNAFLCRSQEVLHNKGSDELTEEVARDMENNVNNHINGVLCSNFENKNIKNDMYRPLTAMLSYIGQIFQVEHRTSFEIVDRLNEYTIFSPDFAHDVKYAIAIACVAREKTYTRHRHQRQAITTTELAFEVGKHNALRCFATRHYFLSAMPNMSDSDFKSALRYAATRLSMYKRSYSQFKGRKTKFAGEIFKYDGLFWALDFFGFHSDALEFANAMITSDPEDGSKFVLSVASKFASVAERNDDRPLAMKAAEVFTTILQNTRVDYTTKQRTHRLAIQVYNQLGDLEKRIEARGQMIALSDVEFDDHIIREAITEHIDDLKQIANEKAIDFIRCELCKDHSWLTKCELKICAAMCHIEMGGIGDAKKELCELVAASNQHNDSDKAPMFATFVRISRIQDENGWNCDKKRTLHAVLRLLDLAVSPTNECLISSMLLSDNVVAFCYAFVKLFMEVEGAQSTDENIRSAKLKIDTYCTNTEKDEKWRVEELLSLLMSGTGHVNPRELSLIWFHTPQSVRKLSFVQASLHSAIHHQIVHIFVYAETRPDRDMMEHFLPFLGDFYEYLSHPVHAPLWILMLTSKYFPESSRRWMRVKFLQQNRFKSESDKRYTAALEMYSCMRMQDCATLLWTVLNDVSSDGVMKSKAIYLLYWVVMSVHALSGWYFIRPIGQYLGLYRAECPAATALQQSYVMMNNNVYTREEKGERLVICTPINVEPTD